ncbi:acyl carrier protein [Streptomyces sp. CHA1]|uniref:acyl carrier protein n=1 Tax=Actinomycetes TaxID=1760 RepID=UPI0002DEE51F|nr:MULTISPECIES: acyl carrier protein [Streptomyces]QOZ97980.1 acyl carrier protein [Streptomyces violascens]WDV34157.1 acyl carrier protein [Streptomyces sp. AD16]ESP95807.1 phosphopantetheine-binding protein [Streptomyces sp. GBA 94-10 4N24]ESQ01694.1 phosphopantetheine-binding protein [Streptomyces sp. GBA 94-10 4N24]ESQ01863.1 phosphopantetheine-binding protein [Streptomyces sp. PVA_94-07]
MFDTLKEILVSKLKVSPDMITQEATPEEAELDSLAVVELSMLLEKDYAIQISDDELMEATTIGEMARMITERRAAV